MNQSTGTDFSNFLQQSQQLLNRCLQRLATKNSEYSDNQDAFANFKLAAQIAGIPAEKTLLALLGMKFSRLHQLTAKGKQSKSENVEETLVDIINYTLLLRGILEERGTGTDGHTEIPLRTPVRNNAPAEASTTPPSSSSSFPDPEES